MPREKELYCKVLKKHFSIIEDRYRTPAAIYDRLLYIEQEICRLNKRVSNEKGYEKAYERGIYYMEKALEGIFGKDFIYLSIDADPRGYGIKVKGDKSIGWPYRDFSDVPILVPDLSSVSSHQSF